MKDGSTLKFKQLQPTLRGRIRSATYIHKTKLWSKIHQKEDRRKTVEVVQTRESEARRSHAKKSLEYYPLHNKHNKADQETTG